MYESVLWGWWGDNILNHIYIEFYLSNKWADKPISILWAFQKRTEQLQTCMSLRQREMDYFALWNSVQKEKLGDDNSSFQGTRTQASSRLVLVPLHGCW